MTRVLRPVAVASLSLVLLVAAACNDDSSSATTSAAAATTATADASPTLMTSQEGAALIADTPGLTVVDVRTPDEYAAGHVDGAINIDVEGTGFEGGIAALDPSAPVLVYCQSGRRSALAAQALVQAGFTQIYDMGGLTDWVAAGLPVTTD